MAWIINFQLTLVENDNFTLSMKEVRGMNSFCTWILLISLV